MADHQNTKPDVAISSKEAFNYQLEFLKLEFQQIGDTIGRIDEMTSKVKNWAIVTWAGSIVLGLSHDNLKRNLWLSAVLPMLFFFVDAWWRRIQRSFIFRVDKIAEFLNDDRLRQSFQRETIVDFYLLDMRAKRHAGSAEYVAFTSIRRTIRFWEVATFYVGLSLISLIAWLVLRK